MNKRYVQTNTINHPTTCIFKLCRHFSAKTFPFGTNRKIYIAVLSHSFCVRPPSTHSITVSTMTRRRSVHILKTATAWIHIRNLYFGMSLGIWAILSDFPTSNRQQEHLIHYVSTLFPLPRPMCMFWKNAHIGGFRNGHLASKQTSASDVPVPSSVVTC